ncbi:MAG TPA: YraN family protein [Solirubrobacteraceae bacterium]|jgi:putative endonuclease
MSVTRAPKGHPSPCGPERPRVHGTPRLALGRQGEDVAAAHLTRLGYRVLARNARTRQGEIDLIVAGHGSLVFVEVKTRRCSVAARARGAPAIEPLAALRPRQRVRLRRLAAAWMADGGVPRPAAREIRFDAVGVVIDATGRLARLDHVEAAW